MVSQSQVMSACGRLTRRLGGNTLEDIIDEGVENSHRLVGDTSIWVDLLED